LHYQHADILLALNDCTGGYMALNEEN